MKAFAKGFSFDLACSFSPEPDVPSTALGVAVSLGAAASEVAGVVADAFCWVGTLGCGGAAAAAAAV